MNQTENFPDAPHTISVLTHRDQSANWVAHIANHDIINAKDQALKLEVMIFEAIVQDIRASADPIALAAQSIAMLGSRFNDRQSYSLALSAGKSGAAAPHDFDDSAGQRGQARAILNRMLTGIYHQAAGSVEHASVCAFALRAQRVENFLRGDHIAFGF